MINPKRSPLRLRYVERRHPEDGKRYDACIGARWAKKGTITSENLHYFLRTVVCLLVQKRKVPRMPECITVELTARQFSALLVSDLGVAREWVMCNLTPRLVTVTKRRAA